MSPRLLHLASCLSISLACAIPMTAQTSSSPARDAAIESALQQHEFERALQLAQPALQQNPRNPKLLLYEGIARSGLGRRREALDSYNRALQISPDYLPALEGAAQLEYEAGSERARPLLERIIKLRPGDPTANAMLGVLSYKKHDCALAAKHFALAMDRISSQPVALAEYGSCLVDLEKPVDALPVFQKLLSLQPDDAHARYNLAVVELQAHQAKEALETLQPLLTTSSPDPDVLDVASSAYEDLGDTPKAVSLLRQAIVLDPKKVRYYVDFAALSFTHQSFQVGVDMIDAGLKANPNAAQLFVARGVLLIQAGQYDNAEADFATANELDPKQSSGSVAQGLAQMQQSNLDQALVTVREHLRQHPQDAFLHYLEAQILFQQGSEPDTPQFKDAIAAASRAEQLKADLVLAYDLLGNLYLKSGEIEESIAQSRHALELNRDDQEALYHLIQALRQSGKEKAELPSLVKRLAELRQQARQEEAAGNRYKLYEANPSPQ